MMLGAVDVRPQANAAIVNRHVQLKNALKGPDAMSIGPSAQDAAPSEAFLDGSHLVIRIETAGAQKGDLAAEVRNGILIVRVTKRRRRPAGALTTFVERSFGTFERSFALPPGADAKNITATRPNGTLTLRVPIVPPPGIGLVPIDIK